MNQTFHYRKTEEITNKNVLLTLGLGVEHRTLSLLIRSTLIGALLAQSSCSTLLLDERRALLIDVHWKGWDSRMMLSTVSPVESMVQNIRNNVTARKTVTGVDQRHSSMLRRCASVSSKVFNEIPYHTTDALAGQTVRNYVTRYFTFLFFNSQGMSSSS